MVHPTIGGITSALQVIVVVWMDSGGLLPGTPLDAEGLKVFGARV